MDFDLPSLWGYSAARIPMMVAIPTLTAHTIVKLARQLPRSSGIRLCLWLGYGSFAVTMGLGCAMELAAGSHPGTLPSASPEQLLRSLCAFVGSVWVLFALSRQHLPTSRVIASSLAVALGLTASGDIAGLSRRHSDLMAFLLDGLSFLVMASASYLFLKIAALAKLHQSAWSLRTLGSTTTMGLLMISSLVFGFQAERAAGLAGPYGSIMGGLPLPALCLATVLVLGIALAATEVSRKTFLLTKELERSLDQERMQDALVEQRVARLQNEALLQEMQERQSAEGKLLFAAFHDSLTGLENRTSLALKLADLVPLDQQRESRPWVTLLNLDGLKGVNDLFGRGTGDLVLQEIANRLQRFTMESDVLARLGSDEFLLLTKHMPTQEQALRKAHLMLSSIEEQIAVADVIVNLSASMGLCEISSSHHSAEDVFRDADTAMQVAKREGGGRCKLFISTMRDDVLEAQRRKIELKVAVEHKEFVLHYQPFVDMHDRSIYGVEALIRWNHPSRGMVAPGSFIPLAEETGQILAIGLWTLQQACRDFATLQANSARDLLLSVNVSPRQLLETPFVKILEEVLEQTSIPPSQLQLEITESIFLKDAESIGSLLHDIRMLGVKIAFDDFGTGYSSLSYLTRYPIDTLKVDQSFVRAMNQSEEGANLVLFILALASEFKMSVTAEGVEEIAQEAALLKQGCIDAQGYLYSRPVPLDAMVALLRNGLKLTETAKPAVTAADKVAYTSGSVPLAAPMLFPSFKNH
jgi:diguanylate cyclase (GGDEF)-like protein